MKDPASGNTTVLNVPSTFLLYSKRSYVSLTLILSCFRYFETDVALQSHWRSKIHKRRCKLLKEPAYTIEESERAAGLGREHKRERTLTAMIKEDMTEGCPLDIILDW